MSESFVFEDGISRVLLQKIESVAARDSAVLITGPTGSGKEVIARLLHDRGARKDRPFVSVHCGAISDKLFESVFFGHVRGAFTGSTTDHVGYLAEAEGGTLFLDEIGELPLEHQVKLLRALDGYPFRPVGARKDQTADVRFISATNRDLERMCRDGRFREDLYGRISYLGLHVPALDERPGDVCALARLHAARHRPADTAFVEEVEAAAARLNEHPGAWPLGIRQIQAFASRADCFGVDEAEHEMRSEWQRQRASMGATEGMDSAAGNLGELAPGNDDRDALANLIQARLGSRQGKPMRAASRSASQALAEVLLGGVPVPYDNIQKVLGDCDRRTLLSNLRPLIDVGIVFDHGDRVNLVWPPVLVRFSFRRDETWLPVPPGAIPLARAGDRLRIEVTALLPIMLQVFVVTHRRTGSEPRQRVTGKLVSSDQTKPVELELDDAPGFEQILVHLAWPSKRGVREVVPDAEPLPAPRLHILQRERMRLLEHAGPGWVLEYLVHHL